MPRKARMQDVADLAGVSLMTVSRALNKSGPVSVEISRKVLRAVAKLDFRPNETARSLRQGTSRTIGLIVPNFFDTFYAICTHAITVVANECGYSVVITTSNDDPEVEFREAGSMLRRDVEGMLVIPAAGRKTKLRRGEFGATTIVALDRPIHGAQFDSVLVDNKAGARMGTAHLIEHKHERICYLGHSRDTFTHRVRYEGYRQAVLAAGLVPEAYFNCRSREETYAIVRSLMDRPGTPTAFFAGNNLVMRHLLHALSEMEIEIPSEVAVAGFDDFDMADIFHPALTVVRQPADELGRVAAGLLFATLAEKQERAESKRIVLPVELIIRRSCGCNVRNKSGGLAKVNSRLDRKPQ